MGILDRMFCVKWFYFFKAISLPDLLILYVFSLGDGFAIELHCE